MGKQAKDLLRLRGYPKVEAPKEPEKSEKSEIQKLVEDLKPVKNPEYVEPVTLIFDNINENLENQNKQNLAIIEKGLKFIGEPSPTEKAVISANEKPYQNVSVDTPKQSVEGSLNPKKSAFPQPASVSDVGNFDPFELQVLSALGGQNYTNPTVEGVIDRGNIEVDEKKSEQPLTENPVLYLVVGAIIIGIIFTT